MIIVVPSKLLQLKIIYLVFFSTASLAAVMGSSSLGTGMHNPYPNSATAKDRTGLSSTTVAEVNTPVDSIAEEKPQDLSSTTTETGTSTPNVSNNTENTEKVETKLPPKETVPLMGEGDVNMSKTQAVGDNENSLSVGVTSRNANRWRHSAGDCLACVRTRPPSSHELREAFFAGKPSYILCPLKLLKG